MSRYEWERGEFTIPSAEWPKFKAAVREAANKVSAGAHELAVALHAELRKPGAKPAGDLSNHAYEVAHGLAKAPSPYYPPKYDSEQVGLAVMAVLKREPGKKPRLQSPRKASFPQFGNNVTRIDGSEFGIGFDNETRKVTWEVHENNHACDRARESAVGKAFFAALDKVAWTRGSGGSIIGNDELNRDAGRDWEGGGGSYSKGTWGPEVKKTSPSRSGTVPRGGYGGGGFRY